MTNYGLKFSEEKQVLTKKGTKLLKTAYPTEEFWEKWREDKKSLAKEGYSVSKNPKTLAWCVCIWRDLPEDIKREQEEWVKLSKQAYSDVDYNLEKPADIDYLPYQKVGIKYALERGSVIIGDEMGLGKTIQAIGVINNCDAKRILIVCPASVKRNWEKELTKWLVRDLSISVISTKSKDDEYKNDIMIINYDILKSLKFKLGYKFDLIIFDESHYLKNGKADRTKNAISLAKHCDRKILLTGTPILGFPRDLLAQLRIVGDNAMKLFNYSTQTFLTRYCEGGSFRNPKNGRLVQKFDGATNIEELSKLLRSSCFIARKKSEVLTDLPEKSIRYLTLGYDKRLREIEKKIEETIKKNIKNFSGRDDIREDMIEKIAEFSVLSEYRALLSELKKEYVIEYLENFLESTDRKIVVFGHFKDCLNAIYEAFKDKAVMITGDTDVSKRQAIVESFQNDSSVRVFVGSMHACGVGITLTSASDVLFSDLDWTPAIMSQAEDRCHRIGQLNSVFVTRIVFNQSIERMVMDVLDKKQKTISKFIK